MKNTQVFKRTPLFFLFLIIGLAQLGNVSAEFRKEDYPTERLDAIHKKMTFLHGDLLAEYPEQLLTSLFLPSDAKVLELGADVGRNTCIIAQILDDSSNLVTVEPNQDVIFELRGNRDCNGLKFHIETSAISKVPLIRRDWTSIPSVEDKPGYTRVDTTTFDEVQEKYGIIFDTLVVDCEGALYYMLKDDPDILRNIKLVIVENDYSYPEQYYFVADLFRKNGLEVIHNGGDPYWDDNAFYQVWKK